MSESFKYSLIGGIICCGIVSGYGITSQVALAQSSLDSNVSSQQEQRPVSPLRKMREDAANAYEMRQDIRQDARIDAQGMRDTRQQQRQDFSEQARTMREDAGDKLKNATSSASRKAIREDIKAERESFHAIRVEARTEFKSALGKRLATHKTAIVNTFSSVIDRMNILLEKLQSHIAKIEEQGGDVSAANTAFATARKAVEDAATAIETADSEIVAIIDGDATPTAKRQQIRDVVQKVRQAIRNAHTAIKSVFETLTVNASQTTYPTGD